MPVSVKISLVCGWEFGTNYLVFITTTVYYWTGADVWMCWSYVCVLLCVWHRENERMTSDDEAVQFHIMMLQLLVMLISDKTVMQREVSWGVSC